MLSMNRKLSHKGFSLIELMVAIVILGMVVFGIFLAFSTGFQGMADARDRTEAVNYIQKTLEEYKNTPFNKIIDKPMRQIAGTKFLNGSIVIDMSELGEETRLKKIITQVRWTARNGDIKIEEVSTLIYSAEKTGELLSASEIVLYASPYFRILPFKSTDLYVEIHDANGNIITNGSYIINFVILSGDELGYLSSQSDNTNNGIATVKFWSNVETDGSVLVKASTDLDGDLVDEASDTITITISTGAEGIILVPPDDASLAGTSVNINLYIVDASFNYESGLFEGYTDPIILNVTGPATLSVNSITAPDGTANFTLNSNGTPGTVEIIASAPDLDLGYTEVIFTGGAKSIQLTPKDASIYEGESIEIVITILDENLNQTPFTGSISITSDNGGSFNPESPIGFVNQSARTVDFSSSNVGTIIITASGTDFENDVSINLEVLESLTPSYIELSAIPSSVRANGDEDDYAFITATVYDDSDPSEVVTNYTTPIAFSITGDTGYFLNEVYGKVKLIVVDPSHGDAMVSLYSDSSGTATVTVASDGLTPDSINITFYSSASGLIISSSKSPVVANGVDYTVITVKIIDDSENIVSNYSGDISLTTDKGYFEGESPSTTLNFNDEGSKSINLYSDGIFGDATITAIADEINDGFSATVSTTVTFTEPQSKYITYVENSVESYNHYTLIKFDIQVTGEDVDLSSMLISWLADTDLDKIEIMSPKSSGNYEPYINTGGVSSSYTYESINTILSYAEPGLSTIRLTFSDNNKMKKQNINITFYEDETHYYPITVYVPQ